ncbi:MAG TPA: metalloregulator ArsR/SmtB family transcription factor [Salinisphaeraceae bacterium]|nr:metalloregulator ArsR/SmtB family transcription factor [Salinisphaeraceae bacterium]
MLDLSHSTQLLRLLAEPTRLRLLLLLTYEALTVAEITAITKLSQSRISRHLARLREAGLVQDRAAGNANIYSADAQHWDANMRPVWGVLIDQLDDVQIQRDRERAAEIVRQRADYSGWAESVAGRMERQYSPGRTWEAMVAALVAMLELGDVLDIASGDGVLAELMSRRARSFTCLDRSEAVIAAARRRLTTRGNVAFEVGDMHALPFVASSFDQVFLLHALTYSHAPAGAIAEVARVLRPGGHLVLATLARHTHQATVSAYDHINLGFSPSQLADWISAAGMTAAHCEVTVREQQPPYFQIIIASAGKP